MIESIAAYCDDKQTITVDVSRNFYQGDAGKFYLENEDGKIEELLNIKLGNIDKHLSSMLGQLSKDLALVYGTSIYNLQKTLDLLGLDTKQKYTDAELMKIMETRGDAIHNHLMIRARENKRQRV